MHTVDCESVDDKSLQKLYQEVHKIVLYVKRVGIVLYTDELMQIYFDFYRKAYL